MEDVDIGTWDAVRAGDWEAAIRDAPSAAALRPFLPCLFRAAVCPSAFSDESAAAARGRLLGDAAVSGCCELISADWPALEGQLKKEQALKKKTLAVDGELRWSPGEGMGAKWEAGDANEKATLVLGPLVALGVLVAETDRAALWERRRSDGLLRLELVSNPAYRRAAVEAIALAMAEIANSSIFDLARLSCALLHLESGSSVIVGLALCSPEELGRLIRALWEDWAEGEPTIVEAQRIGALRRLLALAPERRLPTLTAMSEAGQLCSLVLEEAIDLGARDGAAFLLNALRRPRPTTHSPLTLHLHGLGKRKSSGTLERFLSNVAGWIRQTLVGAAIPSDAYATAQLLINLVFLLKTGPALRLGPVLGPRALELLCSPVECPSVRTQQLATLLALPGLLSSTGTSISCSSEETKVAAWLTGLRELDAEGEPSECGELLLLAALQFHTNQLSLLPALLSSVLHTKVSVQAGSYGRLRHILRGDVYPESMVAARASRLPVTPGLSADAAAPLLPIDCVLSLLSTRTFAKHQVRIKDWIQRQMRECGGGGPIHAAMVGAIDAYVRSILHPLAHSATDDRPNAPLNETHIAAEFPADLIGQEDVTVAVLFLYYLLAFSHDANIESAKIYEARRSVPSYSSDLWERIPMKYLTLRVQADPIHFAPLYQSFLKHIANQFPYLLSLGSETPTELVRLTARPGSMRRAQVEDQHLVKALELSCVKPTFTLEVFKRLGHFPMHSLDTLAAGLPSLLAPGVPRSVLRGYVRVWRGLEKVAPRRLWAATASALVGRAVGWAWVEAEPLGVLGADARLFRSPELLRLLLGLTAVALEASKVALERRLRAAPPQPDDARQDLQNKATALIQAQESAAVQIMLEICERREGDEESEVGLVREVHSIVCAQIHQIFIRNPIILKLVHFQGYATSHLSMMGMGVPSLHIALDFVPELVNQESSSLRELGVALTAAVGRAFPIPKSLAVAQLVLRVLSTLLVHSAEADAAALLRRLRPSLEDLADVFPPLKPDVRMLSRRADQLQALADSQFASPFRTLSKRSLKTCVEDSSKRARI